MVKPLHFSAISSNFLGVPLVPRVGLSAITPAQGPAAMASPG